MLIFADIEQHLLLWRFIHHLPNYTRESWMTSWKPCWLLQTKSFARFSGHALQYVLWLSPTPLQNLCGTFAKISLFTDPSHQEETHQRKTNTVWPSLWHLLAYACDIQASFFGMSITAFSMSTTAIFATRLFGTVRKDLNRAITVRIRPLPDVAPRYTLTSSLKWSKYQKTGIHFVFSVTVALLKEKNNI